MQVRDKIETTFERFQVSAQIHGFGVEGLTVVEEDGIFWLLNRNPDGTYSDTLFPRLLGTSKSQAMKTLQNYTGALNAVLALDAVIEAQDKERKKRR